MKYRKNNKIIYYCNINYNLNIWIGFLILVCLVLQIKKLLSINQKNNDFSLQMMDIINEINKYH